MSLHCQPGQTESEEKFKPVIYIFSVDNINLSQEFDSYVDFDEFYSKFILMSQCQNTFNKSLCHYFFEIETEYRDHKCWKNIEVILLLSKLRKLALHIYNVFLETGAYVNGRKPDLIFSGSGTNNYFTVIRTRDIVREANYEITDQGTF